MYKCKCKCKCKKRNINEWNKLKIHMKLNIQMLKRQFKFIFT